MTRGIAGIHQRRQKLQRLGADRSQSIKDLFAGAARLHQVNPPQQGQMMAGNGLAHRHRLGELSYAFFAFAQLKKESEPAEASEGGEEALHTT